MEIQLYAIMLDRPLDDAEVSALMRHIPDERRRRLERLPRAELRYEPLCAYSLLCQALRELYGWEELPALTYSKYGKPGFAEHSEVQFSISHTSGAALVGVHNEPIGVDIEKLRSVSERTMQRIAGVTTQREFFESWVRRESRSKRSGSGLGSVRTAESPTMHGERLRLLETFPGYAACVCTHSAAEIAPVRYFTLNNI